MSQTHPPLAAPSRPVSRRLGWLVGALLVVGAVGLWWGGDIAWANVREYTNTPLGTYSDLAQRWVGTRAALLEQRSPYSPAVVDDIQQLYYGRVIQPDEPHRPLYPQGFYYPLFVVWLLAPLALLPFPLASVVFKLLAAAILVGGVYAYLQILGWPTTRPARLALSVGGLLLPAALLVIRTDQPTVLVFGLVLGALVALGRQRYGLAGIMLALAWIKPQVAAPLTVGLSLWALADRTRRRMILAGGLTAILLFASSEWLIPGWLGEWLGTLNEYTTVTNGVGSALSPANVDWPGLGLRAGLIVLLLPFWWVARGEPFASRRLQWTVAATLVITTVVQQPWHFTYNQILTYPALLLLMAETLGRDRVEIPPPPRLLAGVTLALLLLPGILASVIMATAALNRAPAPGAGGIALPDLLLLADKLPFGLFLLSLLFTYAGWAWAVSAWSRTRVEPAAPAPHPTG